MSRTASYFSFVGVVISLLGLAGCHSSNAVGTATFAVPNAVNISPQPTASLEVGRTATFSASATAAGNTAITNEPISFTSSNQAVLTVAANGLACAGSW